MSTPKCKRCTRELPAGALFCCWCGVAQAEPIARSNGEGTAYRRGNTWTAKARVFDPFERSATKGGFATKKEALAAVPALRESLLRRAAERISFLDLWGKLQQTARFNELSDGKKGAYRIAFNKCAAIHSVKDVRSIRYRDLQPLVEGLTYYPARDIKVMLNAMFSLAVKNEWMSENPAELIELPKLEKSTKTVFTESEIQQLAKLAETDDTAKLLMLGILTGLRPIELRSVTDDCIRLSDHCIIGAGHKTELGKELPVMLSDEALTYASALMGRIPTYSGDDAFYSSFYSTLEAAGISNADHRLTPNSMRHTFITRLTQAGIAPAVLQKAARHTSYTTTLGYTHLNMDDVLAAVNSLSTSHS